MAEDASLCAAVSAERMMVDVREFARWVKLSGTPEELASLRHVRAALDAAGFRTEQISHDAYISLPGAARLEVGRTDAARHHAFLLACLAGGRA